MIIFRVLALVFGSMLLVSLARADANNAALLKSDYDFRGLRLGMLLSEFKQSPPPVESRQLGSDNRFSNFEIIPLCSDEKKSGYPILRPAPGTEGDGGVECVWGFQTSDSPKYPSWKSAELKIAGYLARSYSFQFVRGPGDNEPRLFRISIGINRMAYPEISSGLRERFGVPTEINSGAVQNLAGAVLSSVVQSWENKTGRIVLIERYLSVDQMWLSYELKTHAAIAAELGRRNRREAARL